jgi:homoprotocatechuate degradation regulator HpaR
MSEADVQRHPYGGHEPAAAALPMRDFSHSLPMALLNARESLMLQFRPLLREYDLTDQQWRVIRVLVEASEMEITELARRSLILSPSLSRILQNLEERKLIRRNVVKSDQRRASITVSAKGRHLFNTVAPRSEALYASIGGVFGEEKLETLYAILDDLSTALGASFRHTGSTVGELEPDV